MIESGGRRLRRSADFPSAASPSSTGQAFASSGVLHLVDSIIAGTTGDAVLGNPPVTLVDLGTTARAEQRRPASAHTTLCFLSVSIRG